MGSYQPESLTAGNSQERRGTPQQGVQGLLLAGKEGRKEEDPTQRWVQLYPPQPRESQGEVWLQAVQKRRQPQEGRKEGKEREKTAAVSLEAAGGQERGEVGGTKNSCAGSKRTSGYQLTLLA